MKALLINLLVAVIWLFLSNRRSTTDFFIGFIVGFFMLALFGSLLPNGGAYPRRCVAVARFALIFIKEFVRANLSVARTVLFERTESLQPNFIRYDVSQLRRGEILLLSYCITLTPGTTTVSVSDDFKELVIHALNASAPETVRWQIEEQIIQPMLRFTR